MKPYHPLFAGRRPTLHISHRGGAALAPENTLEAFRAASDRWHTDMLELDVHLSKDGEAWVSHDPAVDRCTDGKGAIAQLSSKELAGLDAGFPLAPGKGIRIPRLVEVLDAFPNVLFNIDLKVESADAALALADVLRRHPARARVCVGAEWDVVASKLAEELPGTCLFYPRDALAPFVMSVLGGESPPDDDRFHVLDMPLIYEGVRLITPELLVAARERGKWINVWTIDDETEQRQLVTEGVGGIMTDRPDILRRVLDG